MSGSAPRWRKAMNDLEQMAIERLKATSARKNNRVLPGQISMGDVMGMEEI